MKEKKRIRSFLALGLTVLVLIALALIPVAGMAAKPPTDKDGDDYLSDVDCNDSDATVNPGADEVCGDGIDNNCDGDIDEECSVGDDDDDDDDDNATADEKIGVLYVMHGGMDEKKEQYMWDATVHQFSYNHNHSVYNLIIWNPSFWGLVLGPDATDFALRFLRMYDFEYERIGEQ